jgi:predicted nucleic acid-binding protein
MIVLDTNVVSELMKPQPFANVLKWVATQELTECCIASLTQAEILHGIKLLAPGRRRRAIEIAAETMFKEEFAGRILPFDSAAARSYADLVTERRRVGRPIAQFDAQLAAIVRATGVTLATRNVKDFEHCGIGVVDPWAAP